jgi:hypothetical protein
MYSGIMTIWKGIMIVEIIVIKMASRPRKLSLAKGYAARAQNKMLMLTVRPAIRVLLNR